MPRLPFVCGLGAGRAASARRFLARAGLVPGHDGVFPCCARSNCDGVLLGGGGTSPSSPPLKHYLTLLTPRSPQPPQKTTLPAALPRSRTMSMRLT